MFAAEIFLKKPQNMEKKRLLYEAPTAQTVELCHENAMMQTLSAAMPNYGHWITEGTDGWED